MAGNRHADAPRGKMIPYYTDTMTPAQHEARARAWAEEVRGMRAEIEGLSKMLADPEMKAMAEDELTHLREALPEKERELAIAMLPRDSADARPAMRQHRVDPSVHRCPA